jgi:hypothetical protein
MCDDLTFQATSRVSQLLKLTQRQRSQGGFAALMSTSIKQPEELQYV